MPLSRRDLMLGSTAIVTASLVASPGTAGPLDRLSQIVGSPSISLDFAAGSYSLNLGGDTSSISGTVAGLVASKLLSVDRNAAAYAESTTGAWTSFSSNVLRVTNRGALIERAATNYAQNTALTPATGKTLPSGWDTWNLPTAKTSPAPFTVTAGTPVTDPTTGFQAVPVRFKGTNTLGHSTRVDLYFHQRLKVVTAAGKIWVGSAFLGLQSGTLPSTARLCVSFNDASGNATGGLIGATPPALGANGVNYTSDAAMPAGQTKVSRLETLPFTVTAPATACTSLVPGACNQYVNFFFCFDMAAGSNVDFTLLVAMPQLETVPDTEARATSPIPNADGTGIGSTRPADVVALGGTLLTAVQAGQGTLAATLAGTPWRLANGTSNPAWRPMSSVVPRRTQVILGVNSQAALTREADGGVSSSFGGKPRTFRAQITNWANAHAAVLTWGGSTIGVCSTACANYSTQTGAMPAVTALTLGSGGGGFLDGYLQKLTFSPAKVSDLSPVGNIVADVIVYGGKPGGVCAAVRAASEGREVAILGDWREVQLGGMIAGGLGETDIANRAAYGGLGRYLITRVNQYLFGPTNPDPQGFDYNSNFQPRLVSAVCDEMVARAGVNVYWTAGVTSVPKTGTRITSLVCGNTKTYNGQALTPKTGIGKVYVGADYEGDIMPLAGISWTMGRDSLAKYGEAVNGYLGYAPYINSGAYETFPVATQAKQNPYGLLYVDPWVTPGNPASGPIKGVVVVDKALNPGVSLTDKTLSLSVGDADPRGTQAYNFRVVMTKTAARLIPLPKTPPAGFDIADFEVFLRYIDAFKASGRTYDASTVAAANNTTWSLFDLFTFNQIGDIYDINSKGGVSSDYIGKSAAYVTADYPTREKIWQAHITWYLGLWYIMQYGTDPRIPKGMNAHALQFGLDSLHYGRDFHPNDFQYWTPQLYVREARRMVGPFVWNMVDIVHVDGTPPRKPNIIAAASYGIDSHAFYRMSMQEPVTRKWITWNEGVMAASSGYPATIFGKVPGGGNAVIGGANRLTPIPLDAFLPDPKECTNYAATFAGSVDHSGFGSFRMELANGAVGEGVGLLAAMACEQATQPDLQALISTSATAPFNYATLRPRLLKSPAIALGGIAPVAPLVN